MASIPLSVLEICAGAGGQSLGLERSGFSHAAAVEIDPQACQTLKLNRPNWHVLERDVREINGRDFRGIDLFAGGVPCPPFSMAGKQLGSDDERDLFPQAIRLVEEALPSAVMLENVRGFASPRFAEYRFQLIGKLTKLGYETSWKVLQASSFGVPQLRPRFVLVALRSQQGTHFEWPTLDVKPKTVGESIADLMAEGGWLGVERWVKRAKGIAPTIVGGSKKHGGPDLGPTRARAEWLRLGVDGKGIADFAPGPDVSLDALPRLTVAMVARLQGFPDHWMFAGKKTAAYRQVGNAFPPPVARAIGRAIHSAVTGVSDGQGQMNLLEAIAG